MSLTGELGRKDSPVKRFMRETFPNTRGPLAACRDALRTPLISQLPEGVSQAAYGQVGTAIDYRLRYHFAVTDWREFVATRGAALLIQMANGGLATPDEVKPYTPDGARRARLFTEFFQKLTATVTKIAPHQRIPKKAEERTLARFCLALAALEAVFRAGPHTPAPQHYGGVWPNRARDLTALVPDDWVEDAAALGATFARQYPEWHGSESARLNPKFAGSLDIGGADADFIVDGCLWDIKAIKKSGAAGKWLYQLLGYTLLDYDNEYGIERVGLLFPRRNTRVEWSVGELMAEMSGRDDLDLAELRKEFREVCESVKQETIEFLEAAAPTPPPAGTR